MNDKNCVLPEYWQEEIDKKITQINELKSKCGAECASFALFTDFHLSINEKHSAKLVEKLLPACNIPFVIYSGDAVSGAGICAAEEIKGEIKTFLDMFSSVGDKLLVAEGNHDRAYSTFAPPLYYMENIPRSEFDEICFSRQRSYPNRVFGGYGYYFVDDDKSKLRIIILNSMDVPSDEKTPEGYAKYNAMRNFGFLQEQINWFAKDALALPSDDWVAVVCSHSTFFGWREEENRYNYELMLGIIDAFNRGAAYEGESVYENALFSASISVDFSNRRGTVAGWVSGHTHRDIMEKRSSVTAVSTRSDAAFVSMSPEKRETLKEQAVDVFVINKADRCVNIVRIGDGENREFSY